MIHSNYQAYQFSPQSPNLAQNAKLKANSAQNLSTEKVTNSAQGSNTAQTNFALDKSEAVRELLGYGVDSEGYFTSDFNKVAGIPQDYKIHSDITQYFDKISNYHLAPFSSFDLAKTLGNAYQAFEQVFSGINDKQSISEEDFLSLSVAFDYSFNNGNFELHKVLNEYQSDIWQRASGKKQLQSGVSQASLFFVNDPVSSKDFSKLDFTSAFKTNKDGTINKGELLVQFFTEANLGIALKRA